MLCFVFAALVVLLDQFVKRWVLLTIDLYEKVELVPGVIGLTHITNPGAAFSILTDQRWLLIGIAVVMSLLLIAILLRYNDGFWGTLGLAAVLGGTVGNLIDRIAYGHVIDMFELRFMNFAIFNIADIFITLGGITFLIFFIVLTVKPQKSEEAATDDDLPLPEYAPIEQAQVHVEDQIGLYDFQYGDDTADQQEDDGDTDAEDSPESDTYLQDGNDSSGLYPAYMQDDAYSGAPHDPISALDALSELELELQDTSIVDDYDVDKLLQEYGFEDDAF